MAQWVIGSLVLWFIKISGSENQWLIGAMAEWVDGSMGQWVTGSLIH